MYYDQTKLDPGVPESAAKVAWYNAGRWDLDATDGNTGNNAGVAQQGYQGSFAAFQGVYGTDLSNYIGAYGVDTTNKEAWAVLNHASDFAVVPEPATLVLLAAGLLGLFAYARRKRN